MSVIIKIRCSTSATKVLPFEEKQPGQNGMNATIQASPRHTCDEEFGTVGFAILLASIEQSR